MSHYHVLPAKNASLTTGPPRTATISSPRAEQSFKTLPNSSSYRISSLPIKCRVSAQFVVKSMHHLNSLTASLLSAQQTHRHRKQTDHNPHATHVTKTRKLQKPTNRRTDQELTSQPHSPSHRPSSSRPFSSLRRPWQRPSCSSAAHRRGPCAPLELHGFPWDLAPCEGMELPIKPN